jgi:two-component system, OmpR family, alkaline phosphatase synthesis response regulator PhoP
MFVPEINAGALRGNVMNARKVLIVEDDAHMTYMLSYKLRRFGMDVVTACDGEQAYKIASQILPDLILTDYEMPGLTGLEMALRLRTNPETCEIPLVMLTARGHRVAESELSRTNIRHLIVKPFSAQDLLVTVTQVLKQVENKTTRRVALLKSGE